MKANNAQPTCSQLGDILNCVFVRNRSQGWAYQCGILDLGGRMDHGKNIQIYF